MVRGSAQNGGALLGMAEEGAPGGGDAPAML